MPDILPKASADRSHHIWPDSTAAYENRFDEVLSFHPVDNGTFAAVTSSGKAWHINIEGNPIYSQRFDRTFGFYCNYAAVIHEGRWFHIDYSGERIYKENYVFVGNFQEGICVVCDEQDLYYHIDSHGTPLYNGRWKYCGDYREGVAVAQSSSGLSTHINKDGSLVHSYWFLDLDVFHKGFARAKDQNGWFHIDSEGNAIYPERYQSIEPFYNGCSRVELTNGALITIDEFGEVVRTIRSATNDPFAELSADMVGYWRTFSISTFVELGLPDLLPSTIDSMASKITAPPPMIQRLLNAMRELNIVASHQEVWMLTEKGQYLSRNHTKTLASAALEYSNELLTPWKRLPNAILGQSEERKIFEQVASDPSRCFKHHQMLNSYAAHDYEKATSLFNILDGQVLFDAAGGLGAFSAYLQTQFSEANIVLGDLADVVALSNYTNKLAFDLFAKWPITADHVLLARVLHDWPDDDAVFILKNAFTALKETGQIHVIEMLLKDGDSSGSLCDLHLLAATGGQERTLKQFEKLAAAAGLTIRDVQNTHGLVSLITMVPAND
ncbi:Phenazine-1-carboxylate N-methyltransferase [BD1-7 clade bacterium]|uniref:Phenazine-1-carboxylate N-methyltransferase n=1 Tax=BD1-7 clade bacterium TaxID=2029982 RepID=A0A5S9P3R2_9GAMM|nr:Phenazine-1-carboxylate N-methyltransferase [BD1-7 clade bacterium]CAA0122940.1 Phenazine-1-carboxylate N-methyltransferase [BD1-7 clade bacterium]